MASTTKLIVWNAALREIAAAPLANTTSPNTRQQELNGAWDHAVEHVLAQKDWGFARRRTSLTGTADTSFSPYTYRFSKPSDYLRKCWLKTAAVDDYQIDHAEIAAVFYGLQTTALLEYVSDHPDNYDPANWPPHFTRAVTLYLAALIAPKVARAGADDIGRLNGQMSQALDDADAFEAVFLTNTAISSDRQPVMRRALEFIGQQLAGTVPLHAHNDMLRWHMNQSWDHAVKYVLEQGAWNFAATRAYLSNAADAESLVPATGGGITEGYSLAPATSEDSDLIEYDYGYPLPDDFLHKIWIKADVADDLECNHQVLGTTIFCDYDPAVMEYVAYNSTTRDPTAWSANFMEAVAAYLALLVSPSLLVMNGSKGVKISANEMKGRLEAVFRDKLSDAKTRDAIQQQAKKLPVGSFVRARRGGMSRRYN